MTQLTRRDFLGSVVMSPLVARAIQQPPRTFNWVNQRPNGTYPIGVRHATFYSPSNKATVGYCVFLPPYYDAETSATMRYPVIYLLHGGFVGSELLAVGAAAVIDAAMRSDRVPPAIYVFPNGGKVSHYDYPALDSYGETAFVRELIPHVDKTYRTIARREARAVEGFSAGGRGAARVIFKYPELFCSAVPMSGGHQFEKYIHDNKGRSLNPPDRVFDPENNSYDRASAYARQKNYRANVMVVVGTQDANYEGNLDWMKHLDSLGIEYRRVLVEGVGHNMPQILERVGLDVMRFHAGNFAPWIPR